MVYFCGRCLLGVQILFSMLVQHLEQGLLLTIILGQYLIVFLDPGFPFCPIIHHSKPFYSLLTLQIDAVLSPRSWIFFQPISWDAQYCEEPRRVWSHKIIKSIYVAVSAVNCGRLDGMPAPALVLIVCTNKALVAASIRSSKKPKPTNSSQVPSMTGKCLYSHNNAFRFIDLNFTRLWKHVRSFSGDWLNTMNRVWPCELGLKINKKDEQVHRTL